MCDDHSILSPAAEDTNSTYALQKDIRNEQNWIRYEVSWVLEIIDIFLSSKFE